ncbi:hypothetical protein DPEC_G00326820 [Dallia pectoralis]|uniref:Uncharacterized protein n=1 Tax=Dallia pectoralis TaxID=75939 RepID=A0ACC2F801_DALPE|nr:hypothetical protein DPEC_G00326820 [Dallia pectoralis]
MCAVEDTRESELGNHVSRRAELSPPSVCQTCVWSRGATLEELHLPLWSFLHAGAHRSSLPPDGVTDPSWSSILHASDSPSSPSPPPMSSTTPRIPVHLPVRVIPSSGS